MKKRLSCLFAALMLLASLTAPSCAENDHSIGDGDIIYLGYYNDSPIRWKVLDPKCMNTGDAGAYLISELVLEKSGTAFDEYQVGWQGSLAKEWCGKFCASAFSDAEQNVIPAVSKKEDVCQFFGLRWGPTELIDEKVFFISSLELSQFFGGYDGAEGISAYAADGKETYYWLRTGHMYHPDYSGLVLQGNEVHDFLVYGVWGCRPAINIDFAKVMCIVPAYAGASGEWKLVLKDESRGFEVSNVRMEGGSLTADYSIAEYTDGQFISVLVNDAEGNVHYTQRLAEAEAPSGSVTLDMSSIDVPEGGSLLLFAEQDNGDYMTGYASKPAELSCELTFDAGEGSGSMENIAAVPGKELMLPECTFIAKMGRMFDHWENEGEIIEAGFTPTRDITLTAVYKNIPVSSVSFENENAKLELFKKTDYTAKVEPVDAVDKSLSWSSSAENIARVEANGEAGCTVTAKWPGTAVVTARATDGGAEGSFTVTVTGSKLAAFTMAYGLYILAAIAILTVIIIIAAKRQRKHRRRRR